MGVGLPQCKAWNFFYSNGERFAYDQQNGPSSIDEQILYAVKCFEIQRKKPWSALPIIKHDPKVVVNLKQALDHKS